MKLSTKQVVDSSEIITLEKILEKVDELDIYKKYIRGIEIGKIYNSPFRKDKNPSFGIFYSRKDRTILYKDHGTGLTGNIISFVGNYKGINNYNDILQEIAKDLNLESLPQRKFSTIRRIEPQSTVIGIVRQPFNEIDINYWSQFNISEATLKKFNVFSCKYYLCNGIVKGIYKDDNPMYAYKVFNNFKIYRPYGDKFTKWRNNLTEYDIQGYKQLPETGDLLIITKSLKDVMCLYEMGIPAIATSSESASIPDNVLEQLKKRFKRILICFDRDVAGVNYLRKMTRNTGLNGFLMHKKFKAKDISDCIKQNGFETIKTWINSIL